MNDNIIKSTRISATPRDFMSALRDLWSIWNKHDYLGAIFSGWDEEDPSEYYHNQWLVFRASPIQAWCMLDEDRQHILHVALMQQILTNTNDYGSSQ